jgi:hypothetical protein
MWDRFRGSPQGEPGRAADSALITGGTMTGSTGHKCPKSGIWQGGDVHAERIALSVGETFPPCSGCGGGVTWNLIDPT